MAYTPVVSLVRRLTRPLRHGALLCFLFAFVAWANLTPRRFNLSFWGRFGRLVSVFFVREKGIALRNLEFALGLDRREAVRIYSSTFENFAKSLVDLAYFAGPLRRDISAVVTCEPADFARLEKALAAGRGVIGVTGHLSNWELFGGYVASRLRGIRVIAQVAHDRFTDRLLNGLRRRMSVKAIYRAEPASVAASVLRAGGFVGILADLNIPSLPAVTVEFFGRPARAPVGPAVLARRTGAPLVPMCILREADDTYSVHVSEAVRPSGVPRVRDALSADTQALTATLERWIRRRPEQWIWIHDRWGAAGR